MDMLHIADNRALRDGVLDRFYVKLDKNIPYATNNANEVDSVGHVSFYSALSSALIPLLAHHHDFSHLLILLLAQLANELNPTIEANDFAAFVIVFFALFFASCFIL